MIVMEESSIFGCVEIHTIGFNDYKKYVPICVLDKSELHGP